MTVLAQKRFYIAGNFEVSGSNFTDGREGGGAYNIEIVINLQLNNGPDLITLQNFKICLLPPTNPTKMMNEQKAKIRLSVILITLQIRKINHVFGLLPEK